MYKSVIFIQFCVLLTIISTSNAGFWDSLVNVDRSDEGSKKVGVHLPFIYWMDLNRNKNGPKLDISVLGGLVKVNVDRNKTAGKRPVMVRLLGQKVYNSYPPGVAPNNGFLASLTGQFQTEESNEVVAVDKPANKDTKPIVEKKPSEKVIAEESVVSSESKPLESTSVANDVPSPSGTESPTAQ